MSALPHVRDSVREISDNSWIIGGKIILSRTSTAPESGAFWSDGAGGFYTLTDGPSNSPKSRPLPEPNPFLKVYDAGDVSAVWMIGEAYCKVKVIEPRIPRATREHVRLDWVKSRGVSFLIPEVYYHDEFGGRYYLFTSKIYGETLGESWATMAEESKQGCVKRVASIVKELAIWEGDEISGVDGNCLSDMFLVPRDKTEDYNPQALLRGCQEIDLDTSRFYFFHCDLGPGNIIIDTKGEIVGIVDWETAGFVAKEWLRTKFRVSGGLDLPAEDMADRIDWRRRVQLELGREGSPEVADKWTAWFKAAYRQ